MGESMRYYGRRWSIQIDDQDFIDESDTYTFKMTFNVNREFGGQVSYAEISLFNISQSTSLKAFKNGVKIVLNAGYEDTIDRIFSGRIINVFRERQGADIITRLICRGGVQKKNAQINKAFGKDAKVTEIVKECVSVLGYGIVINEDDFTEAKPMPRGYTAQGDPMVILKKLSDSFAFNFLIDGDKVVIVGKNSFRKGAPVIISEFTGMQGIPEVTVEGCDVKVRLDPALHIGARFTVKSEFRTFNFGDVYFREIPENAGSGMYSIYKMIHSGDTHGEDWTTSIVGYRAPNQ